MPLLSYCSRCGRRSMAGELVVGVDLGTTALKAGLFDLEGNVVAIAESGYSISRAQSDWAEEEPRAWFGALADVLGQLVAEANGRRAAAVGVCSQVNTHVFVDASIQPLRPAILWQDQRCDSIADEMNAALMASAPATAERFSFAASSLVCRAEWIAREAPELWARTRFILSPKDYITATLCGLRTPMTDLITPFDVLDE